MDVSWYALRMASVTGGCYCCFDCTQHTITCEVQPPSATTSCGQTLSLHMATAMNRFLFHRAPRSPPCSATIYNLTVWIASSVPLGQPLIVAWTCYSAMVLILWLTALINSGKQGIKSLYYLFNLLLKPHRLTNIYVVLCFFYWALYYYYIYFWLLISDLCTTVLAKK